MDTMHWQRPQMSVGLGPTPVDPQNQVDGNYGGGGEARQGWMNYLQTQGWDGQGMPWQFAQTLRQQGMHPRWDYKHPGQPFPGSLGGLASGYGQAPQNGGIMPPHMGSHGFMQEPPHQMGPQLQPMGLQALAAPMNTARSRGFIQK